MKITSKPNEIKFKVKWRVGKKTFTQLYEWNQLPAVRYNDGETISVEVICKNPQLLTTNNS